RMLEIGVSGLVGNDNFRGSDPEKELREPTPERIFAIPEALRLGYSIHRIHELTHIDKWFLHKIDNIVRVSHELSRYEIKSCPQELLLEAKQSGFADRQIGRLTGSLEAEVRGARNECGIKPYVKQIDTLAAEYPARTNYLYLTYHGSENDVNFEGSNSVIV